MSSEGDSSTSKPASMLGPVLPGPTVQPPAKKRKALEFENVYLSNLPSAEMYEKSYMHRDQITHIAVTPRTDFVVTASRDGHVKFWKKQPGGLEFVKHFRAHRDVITDLSVSFDGQYLATSCVDKTVTIFDVPNFDMFNIFNLDYVPLFVSWVYNNVQSSPLIAISDRDSPAVRVYKAHGSADVDAVVHEHKPHRTSVRMMRYNQVLNVVVSCDEKNVIEYWSPETGRFPASKGNANVLFKYKSETDLYEFAKKKATIMSLSFSKDGTHFATSSSDKFIRVFKFTTGKMVKAFDESIQVYKKLQTSGPEFYRLDSIDFGMRAAVEKELDTSNANSISGGGSSSGGEDKDNDTQMSMAVSNALFDESGNFLIYPTLLGIKIVNLQTNQLARLIGRVEHTERFLSIALFQGIAKGVVGSAKGSKGESDPTIFCAAFKKKRFYCFSTREPEEPEGEDAWTGGRDVFNEKPTKEEQAAAVSEPASSKMGKGAVIHTTSGDIVVRLFGDLCPKAVENFTTHAKNGYYNDHVFHRVIKSFMIQTGDPLGDGTGGTSIWQRDFEDEFHRTLKHDRPYCLSMANAGPNTNGSQFFITTVAAPWLDNKHTLFGRVVKGIDAVQMIERVKTDTSDKPFDEVKMLSISVLYTDPEV